MLMVSMMMIITTILMMNCIEVVMRMRVVLAGLLRVIGLPDF